MINQQLQKALSILEAYEQLEADLIMCDEVWATSGGLPQLPEKYYGRFAELQGWRNDVLGRFQASASYRHTLGLAHLKFERNREVPK
jgi:hypothetical protein